MIFKKGTVFQNSDIRVVGDSMRISEKFAKLILISDKYNITKLKCRVNSDNHNCLVTVYTQKYYSDDYPFFVFGLSGDFGWGQSYIRKKTTFGVRIKRQVFKKILEYYNTTPLPRKDKIIRIINKKNQLISCLGEI